MNALRNLTNRINGIRLSGERALRGDSLHLSGLRRVFDPLHVRDDCRFNRQLIVLAFTNRSGSTYLGQLLASAPDLTGFREDLNHNIAARRAADAGLTGLTSYLHHIAGADTPELAGFGLKASAEQLRLIQMTGIDRSFCGTTIIRIRRRDRVAQAVSLWVAWQTRQWTSRQHARNATLTYDYFALRKQLAALQEAEGAMDLALSVLPYPVLSVEYETLCDKTEPMLSAIRAGLGLPPTDMQPSSLTERQASEEKTELVARFRADLSKDWSLKAI